MKEKEIEMNKCQCNANGYDHAPGECEREAEFIVARHQDMLYVCDGCILPADINVRRINLEKYRNEVKH